jgi:hypothetical protein
MLVPVLMMSLAYLAWQYYYWHVFQDPEYQFEKNPIMKTGSVVIKSRAILC